MYKTLLENRITLEPLEVHEQYRCVLCQYTVPLDALQKHINEKKHQELCRVFDWNLEPKIMQIEKLLSLDEDECKKLIQNGIYFKNKTFLCGFCNCRFSNAPLEHIKGKTHKRRYEKYYAYKVNPTNNVINNSAVALSTVDIRKIEEENELEYQNKMQRLSENEIEYIKPTKMYMCKVCTYSITGLSKAYDHTFDAKHKKNLRYIKNICGIDINKDCDRYFYCKMCNVYLSENETLLQCHSLWHLHVEQPDLNFDMIEFKFNDNKTLYIKCLLCDTIVDSDKVLAEHLTTQRHTEKFDIWFNTKRPKVNHKLIEFNIRPLHLYSYQPYSHIYIKDFCNLCYEPVGLDHESSMQKMKHKPRQKCLDLNHESTHFEMSLKKHLTYLYKCFLCDKKCLDVKSLFKHYNQVAHKRRYILFHTEENSDSSDEETNSKTTSEETSTPVKKKANINKSDVLLRYNKDLLIIGTKYLSMCLEPGKKNIYNIDKEKLHLMRFGLSMLFLSRAESYCFACDLNILYDYQFIYDHLTHETHIQNLNILSKYHFQSEKSTELSHFDLAKELMTETSEERIKCFPCNINILNSENEFKSHKKLENHISKWYAALKETESVQKNFSRLYADIWYYVDKFFCKICNLYFIKEIKFARHLNDSKHLEKIESLQTAEEDKVETETSVCHSCSSCWFGEPNFSKHQKDPNHVLFKKKTIMFPKMRNSVFTLLNSIDNKVTNLIGESDALAKKNVEEMLLKCIEETVFPLYPNAKAYAFGSRSSHLSLNSSDLDVFLDCENNYKRIGSKEMSQKYIRDVTHCFFNVRKDIWKRDCVLLNPRVPIIKLQHKETGIFCDISFLSGLGVEKSKLIKKYVVAYKYCREMILYLKKWFNASDLYGPQAVNAYAITWFVIFYLQIEGIFPSVYSLIKMNEQSNIVDGWECGFPKTVPMSCKKVANKTLKDLLKGFFSYYTNFNYQTSVVCPYLGVELDKSQFAKNELPYMNNYYNRLKTEDIELFRFDSPMCVQDPVDHSQNITKVVTKYQLRCFRYYCFESSKKLLRTQEFEQQLEELAR